MLRAPAAARAAFVPAAAAALLLLALLARPAAAQSEAVQVPCNLQNANVTVAYLGPAGSNRTGLLCGFTLGSYFTRDNWSNMPSAKLTCYDSVQPVLIAGATTQSFPQLPAHGIVFHDFLLCTPPPFNPFGGGGGTCSLGSSIASFIVYLAMFGYPC